MNLKRCYKNTKILKFIKKDLVKKEKTLTKKEIKKSKTFELCEKNHKTQKFFHNFEKT